MTTLRSKRAFALYITFTLALSLGLISCNSADNNPHVGEGHADGSTLAPGTPDNPQIPTPSPSPDPNSKVMRIAVKYVALKAQDSDAPSPSRETVETLMQNMSNVWSQCEIQFVLEEYVSPTASSLGLDYTPANHWQLDDMREEFDDGRRALLVKTGTWDRSGDLGYDGSNGFSTLPPSNPEGAVMEARVGASTLLIAHELGHLIGALGHTTTTTNLMNHYVTSSTTKLTQSQCDYARNKMRQYHAAWIR